MSSPTQEVVGPASCQVRPARARRQPHRSMTASLGYGRDLPSVLLGLASRALPGLRRLRLVGHELARSRPRRPAWTPRLLAPPRAHAAPPLPVAPPPPPPP